MSKLLGESNCSVCCEDVKHPVICMGCKYETCTSCVKNYILSQYVTKCMNCDMIWDEIFIRNNLPAKWINNEYKNHKKNILIEMEKSYMQESIVYVNAYKSVLSLKKQVERNKNKLFRLRDTRQDYIILKNKLADLTITMKYVACKTKDDKKKYEEDLKKLNQEIEEEEKKQKEYENYLQIESEYSDAQFFFDLSLKNEDQSILKKKFTMACIKEKCKGFLREIDWKCELCETQVCKICFEEEEEKHLCNPETIETAKLIEKETKGCPCCGLRVYKTSGCNHMFCTQCKTGFDWRSGEKIEAKKNTNSYFYKWLNSLPEEEKSKILKQKTQADSPSGCNANEFFNNINLFFQNNKKSKQTFKKPITNIYYLWGLLDSKIQQPKLYDPSFNRLCRIRYLSDNCKIKDVETMAYKNFKKNEYQMNVYHIFQCVKQICFEWLFSIYNIINQEKKMSEINISIIKESIDQANKDLYESSKLFGYTTCYFIEITDENFFLTSFKIKKKSNKK